MARFQKEMSDNAQRSWPSFLWLVRHGQSAGNVARDRAESGGGGEIDIAERDADVPLSPLGERQSRAIGRWFGRLPPSQRPDVILTSPYLRARQTADIIVDEAGLPPSEIELFTDERLREKEFGLLDRLTRAGILERFPEQANLRARLGKFYHRPPGGESWCDVILRVRSVMDEIQLQHARRRLLVVAHQVIVLCFRYVLERMTEQEVLAVDAAGNVANCSVTAYQAADEPSAARGPPRMVLDCYNQVAPMQEEGAPVTYTPDAVVAPR
jgi:probable phosphoglycerate mutase